NTRVVDIVNEFHSYDTEVDVYDPWIDPVEAEHEYGIIPISELQEGHYDALVLAVAHREFLSIGAEQLRRYCKPGGVLYDVKHVLPSTDSDGRL
ncbi:MAG: Vi polysaccharide biosynthesis UDP-N-acetylglucosamine C-6 dehydrogenase TviB, partial [Gammaproteobacteria bacterium]|nr:Vi polysaccharide biosynthesis UDP-N-acetylglucosamine C-6 dehydrogenase TviB [Gammaproteobacteria bacterium]